MMLISTIRRYFIFFTFLLFSLLFSTKAFSAKDSAAVKVAIPCDSSNVQIRKPNSVEQKSILENADYKYDRIGPIPKSPWERFKHWLSEMFEKLFLSKGGQIGFSIFQYIVIIAVIVIIVLLVLKNNIRALFYGKSASVAIDFKEFEEDIHTINFDELITKAISKKILEKQYDCIF